MSGRGRGMSRGGSGGSRGGSSSRGGSFSSRGSSFGRGGSSSRGSMRGGDGGGRGSRGGGFRGGSGESGGFGGRGGSRGGSRGGFRGESGESGGFGGRGGFRGGSRGGFRGESDESDESGGFGGRGGFRGGSRGGESGSRGGFGSRGGSRGGSRFGDRDSNNKMDVEQEERVSPSARHLPPPGADQFMKEARDSREKGRLAAVEERKEAYKSKARQERIDPRVTEIQIGHKQSWTESSEPTSFCKLSCKFFASDKIKKIKVTIDTRVKSKVEKLRTDIHFDDITQLKISEDNNQIAIQTRIPTLFEVGKSSANADGAQVIKWEEGRGLTWQAADKNPHPNRCTINFKDGAFKVEHIATLLKADARLKQLLLTSSPHTANLSRGLKRSKPDHSDDEEDSQDSDSQEAPKTKKPLAKKKNDETNKKDEVNNKKNDETEKKDETKEATPKPKVSPSSSKKTLSSKPSPSTNETKADDGPTAKKTAKKPRAEGTAPANKKAKLS